MELSKKTTILLSPRLYNMLKSLSKTNKLSIGELIRSACEKQYGLIPEIEAVDAIDSLSSMALPVDLPDVMKHESIPSPKELLP